MPLHDASSHFADSMRYLAIGYREGMSSFGLIGNPEIRRLSIQILNSLCEFGKRLWCAVFWHKLSLIRGDRFLTCQRCGHRLINPNQLEEEEWQDYWTGSYPVRHIRTMTAGRRSRRSARL